MYRGSLGSPHFLKDCWSSRSKAKYISTLKAFSSMVSTHRPDARDIWVSSPQAGKNSSQSQVSLREMHSYKCKVCIYLYKCTYVRMYIYIHINKYIKMPCCVLTHWAERSSVRVCFYIAVIKSSLIKSNLGRKGFISVQITVHCHWSLEVRAGAQGRSYCRDHGGMLLTSLLPMTFSACLSIQPRATCPGVALAAVAALPTVAWALPNQSPVKKMLHNLAYWQSAKGIFSVENPFSQMTINYVKLTKQQNKTTN